MEKGSQIYDFGNNFADCFISVGVVFFIIPLFFHKNKAIPVESTEQQWVQSFRLFLLITAHWVPFFTLPVKITKTSIIFLLLLGDINLLCLFF